MSKSKTPCAHPGCRENLSNAARGNLCATHYNAKRRNDMRRCSQCENTIKNANKGGMCGPCKVMKSVRKCRDCGSDFLGKLTKCGRCQVCREKPKVVRIAQPLPPPPPERPYSVGDLIRAACMVTMTKESDIKGPARHSWLVNIRFAIVHLANPYFSKCQIGRIMERDHSTIVHGQQRAIEMMNKAAFAGMVKAIDREARAINTKARNDIERLAA